YPRNLLPIKGGKAVAIVDFGGDSRKGWSQGLFGLEFPGKEIKIRGLWHFIPERQQRILMSYVFKNKLHKEILPFGGVREIIDQYLRSNQP
ncbi:MAG: hypothetical protein K940chlam7_01243, partial [Chlamydiae bacterium]|nr:hypothetical protein [Chlamydiota bacterium]